MRVDKDQLTQSLGSLFYRLLRVVINQLYYVSRYTVIPIIVHSVTLTIGTIGPKIQICFITKACVILTDFLPMINQVVLFNRGTLLLSCFLQSQLFSSQLLFCCGLLSHNCFCHNSSSSASSIATYLS